MALIYNWWSWYVRLAHPKTRLEAITSRPKLLSAVGRLTSHGGQKKILLTITHEAAAQIKRLVANVHAGLSHVMQIAPAVGQTPALVRLGALHRRANTRLSTQIKPWTGGNRQWVTEENRIIRLGCWCR